MAGGDAVVLQRLMALLTAPLSRLNSPEQVGIQAPSAEGPVAYQARAWLAVWHWRTGWQHT